MAVVQTAGVLFWSSQPLTWHCITLHTIMTHAAVKPFMYTLQAQALHVRGHASLLGPGSQKLDRGSTCYSNFWAKEAVQGVVCRAVDLTSPLHQRQPICTLHICRRHVVRPFILQQHKLDTQGGAGPVYYPMYKWVMVVKTDCDRQPLTVGEK